MNDKELADKIVALGVGKANQIYPDALGRFYQIDTNADWQTSVNETKFVRDWRVTGALMEKEELVSVRYWMTDIGVWHVEHDYMPPDGKIFVSESLPRAICEACVDALTQLGTDVEKDKTQDISK